MPKRLTFLRGSAWPVQTQVSGPQSLPHPKAQKWALACRLREPACSLEIRHRLLKYLSSRQINSIRHANETTGLGQFTANGRGVNLSFGYSWKMAGPSALLLLAFLWACSPASLAQNGVAVLTQHNDIALTGANLKETTLNVNNVNTSQFGLLFTRAVDDQIYAQPRS